jgi:hypothetical protein
MEPDKFIAFINAIGEGNIISIGFDNGSSQMFSSASPFSLENNYDATSECVTFKSLSINGLVYNVYKPLATIQSICTAYPGFTLDTYMAGDNGYSYHV